MLAPVCPAPSLLHLAVKALSVGLRGLRAEGCGRCASSSEPQDSRGRRMLLS